MPPPPWELLVTDNPSMRAGLHWKLLGNGLGLSEQWALAPGMFCRSVVPTGKISAANGFDGKFTPFESTVIPAPSYAPIRVGSCSCSARVPFRVASQPTVASSGKRSTCGLKVVGVKSLQPVPQAGLYPSGTPEGASPNRQTTRRRQSLRRAPEGCVFASMMLEAAPTPCNRTGFHISNNS